MNARDPIIRRLAGAHAEVRRFHATGEPRVQMDARRIAPELREASAALLGTDGFRASVPLAESLLAHAERRLEALRARR